MNDFTFDINNNCFRMWNNRDDFEVAIFDDHVLLILEDRNERTMVTVDLEQFKEFVANLHAHLNAA